MTGAIESPLTRTMRQLGLMLGRFTQPMIFSFEKSSLRPDAAPAVASTSYTGVPPSTAPPAGTRPLSIRTGVLAKGKSVPSSSHSFETPRFTTMRLMSASLMGRRPLRYFDRLEVSTPMRSANCTCRRPISFIKYLMRAMISAFFVGSITITG